MGKERMNMEKKYPNLMPAPTPDGSQTMCGMFDDLSTRRDFIDLNHFAAVGTFDFLHGCCLLTSWECSAYR